VRSWSRRLVSHQFQRSPKIVQIGRRANPKTFGRFLCNEPGGTTQLLRVTFDFPRRTIYFERENKVDYHDLNQVGVTLERRDGQQGYFIAGIALKDGRPTVDGVVVGDRLVKIDDLDVSNATRGAIFAALRGEPGSVRMLVLERMASS
jgi:PDZ domain